MCSSLRLSSTFDARLRIEMGQHQRDGLRMLAVEQLAQLLRIGALQLGQVALRRLLRAPHQVSRSSARSLPKASTSRRLA